MLRFPLFKMFSLCLCWNVVLRRKVLNWLLDLISNQWMLCLLFTAVLLNESHDLITWWRHNFVAGWWRHQDTRAARRPSQGLGCHRVSTRVRCKLGVSAHDPLPPPINVSTNQPSHELMYPPVSFCTHGCILFTGIGLLNQLILIPRKGKFLLSNLPKPFRTFCSGLPLSVSEAVFLLREKIFSSILIPKSWFGKGPLINEVISSAKRVLCCCAVKESRGRGDQSIWILWPHKWLECRSCVGRAGKLFFSLSISGTHVLWK